MWLTKLNLDRLIKAKQTAFEKQIKYLEYTDTLRKISKNTCDMEKIINSIDESLCKEAYSKFIYLNKIYKQIIE